MRFIISHNIKFQSTLSVRRATVFNGFNAKLLGISIHALREESDTTASATAITGDISIHALREESDIRRYSGLCGDISFQSTLSVRRATSLSVVSMKKLRISIHALREESDITTFDDFFVAGISIHALREESDGIDNVPEKTKDISIHALREESDR